MKPTAADFIEMAGKCFEMAAALKAQGETSAPAGNSRSKPEPAWVDLTGLCKRYGICRSTARKLIADGLPFATAGDQKRFFLPDTDDFMKSRGSSRKAS